MEKFAPELWKVNWLISNSIKLERGKVLMIFFNSNSFLTSKTAHNNPLSIHKE